MARIAVCQTWVLTRRRIGLLLICSALALLVPSNGYLAEDRTKFVLNRAVSGQQFCLAGWEVRAVAEKLRDAIEQPGSDLGPVAQQDLVLGYFDAVAQINRLESDIQAVYADPNVADPATQSAPQQAELAALREKQAARRPAVEFITERQVGEALSANGLTTVGHVWPPVRFQFTESPNYLIVSPRDRILVQEGVYLDPQMGVEEMVRIEERVLGEANLSAIVEGTGGFSSYPTMVLAYSRPEWVFDTVAHEWMHTYLAFRPLGWNYNSSGQLRTINETVASIVGEEISEATILRFYPNRLRPEPWPRPLSMGSGWTDSHTDDVDFAFGEFMRTTRLQVDRMLAAGQITEAEAYMESRRAQLVDRGYAIRKLNQAYFAFHGSYAAGSAATDPIGGKLRLLRRQSATLLAFVRTVSTFRTPEDLDAALGSAP